MSKEQMEKELEKLINETLKDIKVGYYNGKIVDLEKESFALVVHYKRLNDKAAAPMRAHITDAGWDLVATSKERDADGNIVYGTGLAFEIPFAHVGLLFPRSSNARKDLMLSNSVGVIDSGYRGEVTFKFKRFARVEAISDQLGERTEIIHRKEYNVGDRVGQLVIIPIPEIEFAEVESLPESERGSGGYGSSGQ